MGIAEVYKVYLDPDMEIHEDEVATWFETGLDVFVEEVVTALTARWQLMNVYLAGGFERAETAEVARRVARNSCSWLMKISEMEAYDWTYKNGSSLMPPKEDPEYKKLAHNAASLDIGSWLYAWRTAVLSRMRWFCSISEKALAIAVKDKQASRKRTNKTAHALQREIDGVLHAIHQDQAKPKRRQKSVSEEE